MMAELGEIDLPPASCGAMQLRAVAALLASSKAAGLSSGEDHRPGAYRRDPWRPGRGCTSGRCLLEGTQPAHQRVRASGAVRPPVRRAVGARGCRRRRQSRIRGTAARPLRRHHEGGGWRQPGPCARQRRAPRREHRVGLQRHGADGGPRYFQLPGRGNRDPQSRRRTFDADGAHAVGRGDLDRPPLQARPASHAIAFAPRARRHGGSGVA